MAALADRGWLFQIEKQQYGSGRSWVYWTLFDFSRVRLHALKNAITNIVLLIVIGVLNLPIYVPALALTLDTSFNMNREFLGQGAANILAGMAGTVPNILVSPITMDNGDSHVYKSGCSTDLFLSCSNSLTRSSLPVQEEAGLRRVL